MIEERWKVPSSWKWVKMADISEVVGGGTPPTGDDGNFQPDGFPWITPADLTGYGEAYIFKGRRSLSERGLSLSSAQVLPKGTVLFSSRAPIGYCAIAGNDLATSQGFKSFILWQGISAQYTRFYLLASTKYAESLAKGTTFKELSGARAGEIRFPLAPSEEQRRIAAKIANLNLRSKSARKTLEFTLTLVERYKSTLLERSFPNIKKGGVADDNPLYPYRTITLGELLKGVKAGKNLRCEERPPQPNEKGVLKVSAVTWGAFDPTASKTLPSDYVPDESVKVKDGDFLFSRANTQQLVGAVVIVKNAPDNLYLSDKILRLDFEESMKKWILWFLRSPAGRKILEENATGNQESMLNISQNNLKAISVPLPPLETRLNIVADIEEKFKRVDQLIYVLQTATENLDDLDHAILTKAFSGNLIAQEANDTSVVQLMDDISTQKKSFIKPKSKKTVKFEKIMTSKKLFDVLAEANEWLSAQEAFRRCGIGSQATTEEIEPIYAELRSLDLQGKISIDVIYDSVSGKKVSDRIKLKTTDQ